MMIISLLLVCTLLLFTITFFVVLIFLDNRKNNKPKKFKIKDKSLEKIVREVSEKAKKEGLTVQSFDIYQNPDSSFSFFSEFSNGVDDYPVDSYSGLIPEDDCESVK